MRITRSRTNCLLTLAAFISLTGLSAAVQAQADNEAILNNIRPVGQVCLVGQACNPAARTNTAATQAAAVAAPQAVAVPVVSVEVVAAAAPAAVAVVAAPVVVAAPAFDAAAAYQMSCFACHSTGAAGAPKTGDKTAWDQKMAKGIDAVVANAMNGINAMPAKGMCMTCTEDNMRTLIQFMLDGG